MSKTNNIYQNKDPKAKFQIDRECRWFYEGTEIKRHAMVCLFARYLKRDDNGAYNIVTPHECVAVGVEHAPFKVINIQMKGKGAECDFYIETNVNEVIKIEREDQLSYLVDEENQGIIPYISIRENIAAIFSRSCMLDLINYCDYHLVNEGKTFGFWSNGILFPVDIIKD